MSAQIASIIAKAVSKGFNAKTILEYLSRNFPQYAKSIANASAMGFAADKVLKHLVEPRGKNPDDTDAYLTDSEKTDKSDKERKRKAALGLGAAALGVGGGLLGLAGRGAALQATEILPALSEQLQLGSPPEQLSLPAPTAPMTPPPGPTPPAPLSPGPGLGQQMQQQAQNPIQEAMQPAVPTQVAQASQALTTPQQKSIFGQLTQGVDINSLGPDKQQQLKFLSMISDKLQSEGKTLNDSEFMKLGQKIKDIVKGKPGIAVQEGARFQQSYPQEQQPIQEPTQEPVIPQLKEQQEKLPMSKGSSVITPTGDIATIEDLPGKTAKVDIEGKKQVHNTEDLIPIPDNADEIGDLYQRLIDKIPEGSKSRVYDAIGYDPIRNAIKYTYHDGKSYIIDDVPEAIAKEIANSGFLAKTTGGNYMGFYYKGNPSIGAGMHVLISDLQKLRGGKGKEYSYKFEELYSQHRLPKQILKERFDKEKLREREEKKKAKKK